MTAPHSVIQNDLEHIFARTSAKVWEDLRGKRLFITGGTGFFGTWLLESFVAANARLGLNAQAVVLTRNPDVFSKKAPHLAGDPSISLHTGDVCDFEFPSGQFSHLIHGATTASAQLNIDQPLFMLETIYRGTERVLDFAEKCGANKLLFASSGAVYGKQPFELTHVSEDYMGAPDPLNPVSAYGEGKRWAELLCVLRGRRGGFESKIARCFAFLGPYLPLDAQFAVGNFLANGLQGGPIRVGGDGTPYRSYLYGADLVIWLWTILTLGKPARAYNVGSDQDLTVADLAQKVAGLFGTDVQIAQAPQPGRLPDRYVPSVSRAKAELGLESWISLEDGLKRMQRFHYRLS